MSKKNRNDLLRRNLSSVLNAMRRENESDTPDFILAQFLLDSLKAFERATAARTEWWGAKQPGFPEEPIHLEGLPEEPAVGEQVTDVHGQVWRHLDYAGDAHWDAVGGVDTGMVTWAGLCAVGWTQRR